MKIQKEKNEGITLIALVITIIILLILAGISIAALSGENGIFQRAKQAKNNTVDAQVAENASIDSYNQAMDTTLGEGETYSAYEIGDEVTVGGENFYVIESSNANTENVTLISKYNLNTAGTQQQNATSSITACAFSGTAYWSSAFTSDPFNLNEYGNEPAGSAIAKAKAYVIIKGGTSGRLLTKEEHDELSNNESNKNMLYGRYATDGYLYYWLGSAYNNIGVWDLNCNDERCHVNDFNISTAFGVRPVMTISKSLVS